MMIIIIIIKNNISLHKVYTLRVNYQYLLILNHFSKPQKSLPMIKPTLGVVVADTASEATASE